MTARQLQRIDAAGRKLFNHLPTDERKDHRRRSSEPCGRKGNCDASDKSNAGLADQAQLHSRALRPQLQPPKIEQHHARSVEHLLGIDGENRHGAAEESAHQEKHSPAVGLSKTLCADQCQEISQGRAGLLPIERAHARTLSAPMEQGIG